MPMRWETWAALGDSRVALARLTRQVDAYYSRPWSRAQFFRVSAQDGQDPRSRQRPPVLRSTDYRLHRQKGSLP
jgi:hypothetical protein